MAKMKIGRCFCRVLIALVGCSCAKVPYEFRPANLSAGEVASPPEAQFERGREIEALDSVGNWVFGLFSKALLWNIKVDSHDISTDTENALKAYVADNQLLNVKVRLNEYAPLDEWERLFANDSIGWGWRLTLGALTTVFYTVLPGRLFGGDNYNPFTDTISLYSDHPAIALHEAGHAKDFADRKWKGAYAALRLLPLTSLFSESEATGDALGYLDEKKQRKDEVDAYKVLYPAYATYIGGEFLSISGFFSPIPAFLYIIPVIPAHIIGRSKAKEIDARDDPRLESLINQLTDENPVLRYEAVREIGEYGPSAKCALAALRAATADEDASVRESAQAAIDVID